MKKKQKEKLLQAFRPSFENARQQLFQHLEKKADELYGLKISVKLNPKKTDELLIENQGPTTRDKQLTVPVDQSFTTIVKRIQKREKGLLDQFATNLTHEIANYWYVPLAKPAAETQAAAISETPKESPAATVQKDEKADVSAQEDSSEASEKTVAKAEKAEGPATPIAALSLTAFTAAVEQFPKFFVEETAEDILLKEKTAKEDRLLATISRKNPGEFTIEKALERKYKLKTEVIPVIEAFAQTPLSER